MKTPDEHVITMIVELEYEIELEFFPFTFEGRLKTAHSVSLENPTLSQKKSLTLQMKGKRENGAVK